jgi:hypothetical protein
MDVSAVQPPAGIRWGTGLFVLTLTGDRICAASRFDNSVLPIIFPGHVSADTCVSSEKRLLGPKGFEGAQMRGAARGQPARD